MKPMQKLGWLSALLGLALAIAFSSIHASAQDYRPPQNQDQDQDQDDPPTRVARLGYMDGSVSFEPAGESDWVQAADNRPLTTGDKLWADKDSRAELQLGSAVIRLSQNTGVSFLNLDDRTVQLQLSAGVVNIRVRSFDRDDVFEIDTPNLAFTVSQPGNYRLEATEDGSNTIVTVRAGDGQATGNGQTYTIHNGQRVTFSGTDSLNADMEQIGAPDQFDSWADGRERRHDQSRSAQYLSHDVVGYDDLDDYGDWRDDPNYGHVWYPNRVDAGWAPYHEGHWDWIDPWGYTWVDDSPWGYAPFHYGRWVNVGGHWGWIAGPPAVRPVYAPALVVFVGGGGPNVGWFPLGPREVFVPSYPVSRGYMNQVNVSNTTVTNTTITNVYNTTVINKTTNITNVTYVNRNVQGAVTAVPQRAFAGAQPVARAAVKMDAREISAAPVSARVAVAPTREAVLGAHAASANHVTAPPAAVANRQVIAKATPPPPPVPFAARQQAMAAHPGQPLPRREVATLRPANTPAAHPTVKVAPPGKPATATTGHPPAQPAGQPTAARPGQPAQPAGQPAASRPGQPAQPAAAAPTTAPANRPTTATPPNARPATPNPTPPTNHPPAAQPTQPAPNNRPGQPNTPSPSRPQPNRPTAPPPTERSPSAQPNRPTPTAPENRSQPNRPVPPPARNDRPPTAQPNNRPEGARPAPQPEPNRNEPARPQTPPPGERPQQRTPPPAAAKPAPAPQRQPAKPQTPEEKKREQDEKPPGE